jgi:hypothetical protein
MKFDGETLRSDARLSLRRQDDGAFTPAIQLIRNKPDLESPYFGVRFTEEDRQNLQKTGNLGRIIEPEYPNGKMPVYLSALRRMRPYSVWMMVVSPEYSTPLQAMIPFWLSLVMWPATLLATTFPCAAMHHRNMIICLELQFIDALI